MHTLKDLYKLALNTQKRWTERKGGETAQAPWPADCACYYCYAYDDFGQFACGHCIHNPEASVFFEFHNISEK